MANGYQTVVSIANDAAASKYLNTDLNNAFWTQQKYFTPVLGMMFEYGSHFKVEPWVKTWNRWVYEDWGGIWIGRLGKYGVQSPASLRDAKKMRTGRTMICSCWLTPCGRLVSSV